MLKRLLLVILSTTLTWGHSKTPENTIRIIADAMDCDQQKNICTATGNAFAERPNDPDQRTIRAEKFIVHFSESPHQINSDEDGPGRNDLDKIEAHGQVVITNKESIILCDKAIYNHLQETVELFDNVKITSQHNQLNGTYGHADLKTKKYRVINKDSQVEGLFVKTDKKAKL